MRKIILFILPVFIIFSCKDEIYSTIPNAPVSYKINVNFNDTQLNAGVGAYLMITQKRLATDQLGYGGLLIVNGIGENPTINLYAYDLACPNEDNRTLIVPQNTSQTGIAIAITAKCPKCGAVFNIIDGNGTPQSGSKYYLRSYQVMKTGNPGEYLVTN